MNTQPPLKNQLIVVRTDANGKTVDPYAASSQQQSIASHLRDKKAVKCREGIFHGQRMEYFKGRFVCGD